MWAVPVLLTLKRLESRDDLGRSDLWSRERGASSPDLDYCLSWQQMEPDEEGAWAALTQPRHEVILEAVRASADQLRDLLRLGCN